MSEVYQPFPVYNNAGLKPIIYKGNASFASLIKSGKLAPKPGSEAALAKESSQNENEVEGLVPGYTGYVRGAQHISGRTFGETTRRAISRDYKDILVSSSIPADVHHSRNIVHVNPPTSFCTKLFGDKDYNVPGTTTYLPGCRDRFGTSFGALTSELCKTRNEEKQRAGASTLNGKRQGYASALRDKRPLALTSNPLPGAIKTYEPPKKLIPAHVKALTFGPY